MTHEIAGRGLVMLGCGKMGSALLRGWLQGSIAAQDVWVLDPYAPDWLSEFPQIHVNADLPPDPAVVLVAVKPQMMQQALPALAGLGNGRTLFLSVAAGIPLATYDAMLGADTPVVRAMPNTPAAIGQGITAIVGNGPGAAHLDLAAALLSAVGQVVRLETEAQMDAVTALSGSGPAYVFYLIEALSAAGISEGLSPDLATRLATATVAGAGALAASSPETAAALREAVTSPAGTTAAGLGVLMDDRSGLSPLIRATVAAAADRSRELGG